MRKRHFHGSWRVVKHKLLDQQTIDDGDDYNWNENEFSLEGSHVEFDKSGFCSWKPHPNAEKYPFMDAETFSINRKRNLWKLWMFTSLGIPIIFDISFDGDDIVFRHKIGFLLVLRKISSQISSDVLFTLLGALRDEEFSDLEVTAKNGKIFKCHKCILASLFPSERFDSDRTLLHGLSEAGVYAVLHFAYSGSLPDDLPPDDAKELLEALHTIQSAGRLVNEIKQFLLQSDAMQVLEELASDIDECGKKIMQLIGSVKMSNARDFLSNEPHTLVEIFKQVLGEASMAFAKFLVWCEKFHGNRHRFPKKSRQDLCKKFVSMILGHVRSLESEKDYLEAVFKSTSMESITALAEYILPQAGDVVSAAMVIKRTIEETTERIMADMEKSNSRLRDQQQGHKSLWKMKNRMLMKMLMTFVDIKDDILSFLEDFQESSEELVSGTQEENILFIVNLLRIYTKAVLQYSFVLDDISANGKRKKSLVFLHILAALAVLVLRMARKQRGSLGPILELFPVETFESVLRDLGLTNCEQQGDSKSGSEDSSGDFNVQPEGLENSESTSAGFRTESSLANSLQNLFETSDFADLEFVVYSGSSSQLELHSEPKDLGQAVVFKAHRVVVAARCGCFRKALSSGMKESSERKFQIEGCEPEIFELFLRYLYTGEVVGLEEFSVQKIAEILTLADRYEVDELVQVCERQLTLSMNEENVLFLVAVADSVSAVALKNVALSLIKSNKDTLLNSEDFGRLPEHLRKELSQTEPAQLA